MVVQGTHFLNFTISNIFNDQLDYQLECYKNKNFK